MAASFLRTRPALPRTGSFARRLVPLSGPLAAAALLAAPLPARAEDGGPSADRGPWWLVGAQVTAAGLYLPPFHSPYASAGMSLGPGPDGGWSLVATLLAGARLWEGAVLVAMPEFADGRGLPAVSGAAGYPDANIIRVAKVGIEPYLARLFLHQDFALGPSGTEEQDDEGPEGAFAPTGPRALRRSRPASRLEITLGKMAVTDFFDVATASSDPRHRFMNWALMTNGAWDFAADTRGYTVGAVIGLEQPLFALRAGLALMPTTANGPDLDADLSRSSSLMVEGEARYRVSGQRGAVKLLWYRNQAHMGSYDQALAAAAPGRPPDVGAVERTGAVKRGLGLLVDQDLGPAAAFLRASWNDGRTETFAFTEIDRAVSAGAELPGSLWGRPTDRAGLGAALGWLSPSHARYLEAGGRGFQLGDGALANAPELVAEAWYGVRLAPELDVAADLQLLVNPGMNADRGPAAVLGVRLHAHR